MDEAGLANQLEDNVDTPFFSGCSFGCGFFHCGSGMSDASGRGPVRRQGVSSVGMATRFPIGNLVTKEFCRSGLIAGPLALCALGMSIAY